VAPARPVAPARASHTWRVAAADYGETTIVLPALAGLRAAAPGTRLAVVEGVPARMARQAEQGEIDIGFHTADGAPEGLRRRVLFAERYVLVGRAGHPRLKRRPTLAQFCQLEHVMVSQDGGGFHGVTDAALAQAGLARRVVLSVPHFLFMRRVLESTDLVAMMPSRLVGDGGSLRAVEAPVDVPGYEMAMLWHERVHRDPAHQWLREHVVASVLSRP
jgi:DNA-binding transcriptional LysR family regulator